MIGVVDIALSKGFAGKASISCQQPGLPTVYNFRISVTFDKRPWIYINNFLGPKSPACRQQAGLLPGASALKIHPFGLDTLLLRPQSLLKNCYCISLLSCY